MEINRLMLLLGLGLLVLGFLLAFNAKKMIYRSDSGIWLEDWLEYTLYLVGSLLLLSFGFFGILYWILPENFTCKNIQFIFSCSFVGSFLITILVALVIPILKKIDEDPENKE